MTATQDITTSVKIESSTTAEDFKRWPSAPSDEWDRATCIQEHDATPPPVGTIHDDGEGTRWVELDGFAGHDDDGYTDIARDIIQRIIDCTDTCDIGTQKAADALTDEICAALGLPPRMETT